MNKEYSEAKATLKFANERVEFLKKRENHKEPVGTSRRAIYEMALVEQQIAQKKVDDICEKLNVK